MSDFVSDFWSYYIAVIVLVGIAWCGVFLWKQSSVSFQQGKTTGHQWDETLEEYNNPMPKWWSWLFYLTLVFSLVYLLLFPGLGKNPGVFGWTSTLAYNQEVSEASKTYAPLYKKYAATDLVTLSKDTTAMATGKHLFQTYCIQCHGSDAKGSPGFPNLTDKDWLWGGQPDQIKASILNGRLGNMPPYGGAEAVVGGPSGAREVAEYVRSLSGLSSDAALSEKGKARYAGICLACHGADGKGNIALGAPDLTDSVWLYGSSSADRIVETITKGRAGVMPEWKSFLGEDKVHVLAAYVISLGGANTAPPVPAPAAPAAPAPEAGAAAK